MRPLLGCGIDSNTVTVYGATMTVNLSLQELSEQVNEWCDEHGVVPANGQAGESITERNIRYYRTLGLVDAPETGGGYGEKHLLQLTAIRVLQGQGLPLRRIRELLYGRSLPELRKIRRMGGNEAQARQWMPSGGEEVWRTMPLDENFMLISRHGTPISPEQREAILRVLQANFPPTQEQPHTRR